MNSYMEKLAAFILNKNFNVYNIAVIEGDGEPQVLRMQPCNKLNDTYSSAKAFCVTAVGMLYDRGLLKPEDRIVDIFREELPEGMDPRWEKATLHMLMKHQAGFGGRYLDIDRADSHQYGEDWLKSCLTVPLDYTPGEGGRYSDASYYLVARAVEKAAGEDINLFLSHELFVPAKFEQWAWSTDPQGHPHGGSCIYLTTGDYAKLGAIYMNGGTYRGHRYLSEEWVRIVLERGYEMKPLMEGTEVYGKGGMHGQKLAVQPGARRVVAVHGHGPYGDALEEWLCKNQE